ncbi:MAG: hypothetical protein LBV03_01680 [Fusobacteriales bacterium]|jgi:hypothetical protein|nr:hypothetical protein [Fusobacteriales bacterium]
MKKICLLLFIILNCLSFSDKGNYDDTKFRQNLISWANSKIGSKYDMNDRWGANTYDCSSFISRGLGAVGMTSISGKKSDYGATAKGLYQASGKIIKGKGTEGLKAGDIAHFSPYSSGTTGHVGIITEVIDSCRVRMTHASNSKPYPKGGVKNDIKNLCTDSHYIGATSASQILVNNGYKPINTDGTVVTPEGSAVGSPEDTDKYYDSGYIIDFDEVIARFADVFAKGVKNLETTLIVIMTYIFAITFTLKCIKSGFNSVSTVLIDMKFDLLKFVFFIIIIKNYTIINNTALSMCFIAAKAFGSDLDNYKVLNQIMTSYIENIQFLIKEFSSESSNILFKIIQNTMTMLSPFKMTIIMGSILYTTAIFAYIVFQITRVVMTYIIANSISILLLPFWFSDFLKDYIPNPLTVFCKSILQMFGSIIFISISLRIIDGVKMNANGSDYLAVFTYIVYFTIVAFILRKILRGITQIV